MYLNEVVNLSEVAWPSGLRRQLKALVRKGVGSNPTAAILINEKKKAYLRKSDYVVTSPPAGIEPATFRLTAERSNHWAKKAVQLLQPWAYGEEQLICYVV